MEPMDTVHWPTAQATLGTADANSHRAPNRPQADRDCPFTRLSDRPNKPHDDRLPIGLS